jgi:NAD(P)-dependent dehydrogenase (short-subunit alcohol dehydrogenase family)
MKGLDMASEVDYEFSLAGNVAVVTGGASEIGAAIGDAYAVKGATVVVLDLAVNAAQRKVSVGSVTAAFGCDVTNEQSLIDVIDAVNRQFGRIDVLVNSAGIAVTDTAEQLTGQGLGSNHGNQSAWCLPGQPADRSDHARPAQRDGDQLGLPSGDDRFAVPSCLLRIQGGPSRYDQTSNLFRVRGHFATTRSAGSAQRSRMNRQASPPCRLTCVRCSI